MSPSTFHICILNTVGDKTHRLRAALHKGIEESMTKQYRRAGYKCLGTLPQLSNYQCVYVFDSMEEKKLSLPGARVVVLASPVFIAAPITTNTYIDKLRRGVRVQVQSYVRSVVKELRLPR